MAGVTPLTVASILQSVSDGPAPFGIAVSEQKGRCEYSMSLSEGQRRSMRSCSRSESKQCALVRPVRDVTCERQDVVHHLFVRLNCTMTAKRLISASECRRDKYKYTTHLG